MSNFETVIYEKSDGIGHVILNRPQVLNAFNIQMRDDLFQVLCVIDADPDLRAVIFSGAGDKAFCAGADLTEFGTAPSVVIARQVRWKRDLWGVFLSIEKPLIAAMHGFVIGSGVEIGLCCDIRIASDDAQFGLPEVSLGMMPAAAGTQTVPRMVGRAKGLELLLTGERIPAAEALRTGLINRLVSRADLMGTADEMAQNFASKDPVALAYAKRAINQGLDGSLDEGLDLEARLGALLLGRNRQ